MILLYSFLLLFLGTLKMLIDRRTASLEKKFIWTADRTDSLLKESALRPNGGKLDFCQTVKRQYLLGLAVQKRDRLEEKHHVWQGRAEQLARTIARLRAWKGKKLPYTFGVLDVSFLLALVDYLGVSEYVNLHHLLQLVGDFISH